MKPIAFTTALHKERIDTYRVDYRLNTSRAALVGKNHRYVCSQPFPPTSNVRGEPLWFRLAKWPLHSNQKIQQAGVR
jgi:hypothetical protein